MPAFEKPKAKAISKITEAQGVMSVEARIAGPAKERSPSDLMKVKTIAGMAKATEVPSR